MVKGPRAKATRGRRSNKRCVGAASGVEERRWIMEGQVVIPREETWLVLMRLTGRARAGKWDHGRIRYTEGEWQTWLEEGRR